MTWVFRDSERVEVPRTSTSSTPESADVSRLPRSRQGCGRCRCVAQDSHFAVRYAYILKGRAGLPVTIRQGDDFPSHPTDRSTLGEMIKAVQFRLGSTPLQCARSVSPHSSRVGRHTFFRTLGLI